MAGAADVANLIVSLRLDDKGFSGKLNAAAGQLKAMDSGLSQMGRGAGQVAGGLARIGERAAIATAGLAAFSVTTAASFEQAETGIAKTVEGTDEQVAALIDKIRQMSLEMPVAFEELAGIAEAGGALGVAREGIDEFTDVVARLSVSTDLTAESAASALGHLMNVLSLGEDDLESFGNSLVSLGNNGASTEAQIVEMAARFGAAGQSAGLTKEEILALSSTVASMGIEVEAGGNSLARLFNSVATNIGTGSGKAKELAQALGFIFEDGSADLEEFGRAWEDNALGTFQQLLEHLNELNQFEAGAFLKGIGVTNTRDVNALRLLAQGAGELGDQLGFATDHQQAMTVESDKFFGTTQANWQKLINNVRSAAATLGSELLPVVNEVMGEFVGWLQEAGTQQGLKDLATDLAEGVRGLVGELKGTDWSGITGGLQIAASVAKTAFDAFRALPEPVQQLAIAALVANKVSGGAIGSIAAGLGNLVFGALKTITAANVTVIGGNVTGGAPGIGGPAAAAGRGGLGGRVLGGLKTAGALAAIPLAGVAAVEVVNFENMRTEATANLEKILDDMPRATGAEIDASIARIESQIEQDRPLLDGILFNTNIRPQLEAEVAELRENRSAIARAEGAMRDAIPWHQRNLDAIHAFNASEGTRFANLGGSVNNVNATLASKDMSPDVTVNVPVTNYISINEWQRTVQSAARSYSTNSGGI